jgi:D-alanyl-D-alanine carboxypeptidase/D-alanyl-D-alanine-endopeptidase (penicillin-binding protein 4)
VRRRISAPLAALVAALAAAPPAPALDAAAVGARLSQQMRAAGAYSGGYARDLDSGRILFSWRADRPRIPASVEKLFVTASTLLRLGPTGRLETRAVTDAPPDPEGIVGTVWLVGGGDPTLDDRDLGVLAESVAATGVTRVQTGVVGDESRFDRLRGGPRTGGRPDRDIGGRIGALVMRRGYQRDPAGYAAQRFARALRSAGITVRGSVGRGEPLREEPVELGSHLSPTAAALARATNVPSDNFIAEMLLKNLGAALYERGTTTAGARAVRATLDSFGVSPRIADGSGLSRANRTSPREVVRLLDGMDADETAGPAFAASMAVAGRSGTVRRRMRGTPASGRCRVKTGTIIGVSNLAGVCRSAGGADVAFAWLMNGVSPYGARAIQDRMTATLARYTG